MTLPETTKGLPEPSTERLQILHMLLHFMDRESDRYWQRNGVFVTISSGFFGLYLAKYQEFAGAISIIYGSLGVLMSLGWLQVLRTGKFYAARWRQDARAYVNLFPDLADAFRTASGNARIPYPKGGKSSYMMIAFAVMTGLVWLGIAALGVHQLTSNRLAPPKPKPFICISLQDPSSPQVVNCEQLKNPS